MTIIEINKEKFENEVLKSDKTVLADFNANWCGPCRMLRPTLEELAKEHDDFKIVSINIDDEEELAENYNISSIPCLIVFKDGTEIKRSIGLKNKEEIENLVGGN